jgi:hypothetical protein
LKHLPAPHLKWHRASEARTAFGPVAARFGAEVNVTGLVLPESLTVHELGQSSHIGRGALAPTWTGTNSEPLHMFMSISSELTSMITYTLECLMVDDGAFEIPEAVMQAVPNGFAGVTIQRETQNLLRDGEKAILAIGSSVAMHKFGYGDRCDSATVVEACNAYADKLQQVYSECGLKPRPKDELCPEFIATACTLCPKFYECQARNLSCNDGRIPPSPGCTCTK